MAESRLSFTPSLAGPAPVLRRASPVPSPPTPHIPGTHDFSEVILVRAFGHGFAGGARKRCLFAAGRFSIEKRVQAWIAVDGRRMILHEPAGVRRGAVIAVQFPSQHA